MVVTTDEKNFPTQQSETQTYPWISGANEFSQWTQGNQCTQKQRASQAQRLKQRTKKFTRCQKLRFRAQFTQVFAQGRRMGNDAFLIIVSPNSEDFGRLGLSISRRHVKKSTQRNQIKRMAREQFRDRQNLWHGMDVVITTRRSISGTAPEAWSSRLGNLFDRLEKKSRKA